jgi:uncharacterized membrane protein YoaK (UPF0700 family)
LLALTFVTGVVDAMSFLALHQVFVANMTGNVVFIGFATAGAPGFSLTASGVALTGFVVGALGGTRLGERWADHRGRLLRNGLALEIVLIGATAAVALVVGSHPNPIARDLMLIVLGAAMGSQNASVRQLGVPDLTTTVLTSMLTGLLADSISHAWDAPLTRRIVALVAMFGGAAAGAALVLDADLLAALGATTGLLVLIAGATHRLAIGAPDWSRPLRP